MSSSQKTLEARRLKGFRDHLPASAAMRRFIVEQVRAAARQGCFFEVQTPALEYAETLLGQGAETDKQCYRFKDHGDRDVALRFDLTVPFARFVVEHFGELHFPFKRLQIGDVWRGENTQKGRYREFGQCDLDIVGVDTLQADYEILSAFYGILNTLPVGAFTMRLGSRPLLSKLLESVLGSLSEDFLREALVALDKLDKIGADSVTTLLLDKFPGSDPGKIATLVRQLSADDTRWTQAFLPENFEPLQRFENLLSLLRKTTRGSGRWTVDLSVARGLAYYDGVVFETKLDSLPTYGSICSGGRYNNLAGRFTRQSLPGVGGSLGLDRVLGALEELQVPFPRENPLVFVAIATEDAMPEAFALVQFLREKNLACEVGLVAKIANQMKHADRLGARFAIVLGSDEIKNKKLKIKHMQDGSEQLIDFATDFSDVFAHIKGK